MRRYVAFLRGVTPMNADMAALRRCFGRAGFADVKTILASGNVVFDARAAPEAVIERRAETAMRKDLGRSFSTFVRRVDLLRALLDADPFASFRLPPEAKRVVTFLRERHDGKLALPLEWEGARILAIDGREVFTAYVPGTRGAAFMALIEKTFGAGVTTRTWDTVKKCAAA